MPSPAEEVRIMLTDQFDMGPTGCVGTPRGPP